MSAQVEHSADNKKSTWIVLAAGCGCLFFLFFCLGISSFLVYTYSIVPSTRVANVEEKPVSVQNQEGAVKSDSVKQQPADFFRFLGVEAGDDLAVFTSIHGDPIRVEDKEKYPFVSYYFQVEDKKVTVRISRKTNEISTLHLYWSTAIRTAKAREPAQFSSGDDFLGVHIDRIKKQFGEPDRSHAGFNDYRIENKSYRGEVSFITYSFHQERCSSITVRWYKKRVR